MIAREDRWVESGWWLLGERRLSTLCRRHAHIRADIHAVRFIFPRLSSCRTFSRFSPFGSSPDLALERARAFNPPRPYNSNVGNPFDWYSHTRYYFYTCDTASVSGDKGNECMTARMGASCVGWSTKFALQFRRNQRVIFCFFLSCRSLFFVNLPTG